MNRQRSLQQLIHSGETLVAPDAYDAVSARLIRQAGYKAVQCSGYSISVSKGYSDERFVSLDENLERTREIASAVDLPVMADGEDGYGDGEVFAFNIGRFLKAGIAGINIEDQNLWNTHDRERIVPVEVLLDKISSVLAIKKTLALPDLVLNARTDAIRSTEDRKAGLRIAIDRANRYIQAGADMVFVAYVRTREEIALLKREVRGPLSIAAGLPYNIAEFSINDCREIGVARVSLPSIMVMASLRAALSTIEDIRDTGTFEGTLSADRLLDQTTLLRLLRG
jgi:2-methylisocitrate lyase-like PEP mutase family enzyme